MKLVAKFLDIKNMPLTRLMSLLLILIEKKMKYFFLLIFFNMMLR